MKFEPIIGLEIHVQLKTKSKMFCSSPNNPDVAEPNVNICEICAGHPGTLPVINREAVRKGVMVGLALGCEIPEYSKFDRKNYFYPDLPKGYQISQYDQPVCGKGTVEIEVTTPSLTLPTGGRETGAHSSPPSGGGKVGGKRIRITRAHLEEDAGKLIHVDGATLVDLNRAGVPLIEIVTEPDFRAPEEAKLFLQNLRNIVRYLGVSDADMEKGHMRCDANISLRKLGEKDLPPYKIEIKNLNSFKAVEAGLNYEIKRQEEALEAKEKLVNETRGWDEAKGITVSQRTKEEAHDYRYFPEPDLPILHLDKKFVDEIKRSLPELPGEKLKRFTEEYALPAKDAEVLIADKFLASYFEEVVSELLEWISATPSPPAPQARALRAGLTLPTRGRETGAHSSPPSGGGKVGGKLAKLAANWIIGDFQALLKINNINPQDSKVSAENLAELIKMIDRGEISTTAGKKVLAIMFEKGGDPSNIVADEGVSQVSDESAIAAVIDKVISENQKVVGDYKAGKKQAMGFLVGKVMAVTKGKANPQLVNKILLQKLS